MQKKKNSVKAYREGAPSAFSITLQTNQSKKSLRRKGINPKQYLNKFAKTLQYIKKNAAKFTIKDMSKNANSMPLDIVKSHLAIEVGENKKLLHAHGYIGFNKYTQLNTKLLNKFMNKSLRSLNPEQNGIVFVKFAPNYEKNLEIYEKKTSKFKKILV